MHNCIAIDWLQCHVKLPCRDFENLFNSEHTERSLLGQIVTITKVDKPGMKDLDNRYLLEKTPIQTRNFKAIYEIKDRKTGQEIAVLAAEPRSLMCMAEDSGLIKITNKYLYQKNFSRFARDLFSDLQLTFINITRVDLAFDFLKFDYMGCIDFIDNFASKKYLKRSAAKMKFMGDSWSVDKGQLTGGISSLKFGLESSDVNYYLYNKTLELKQVKDKPWIRDHWSSNGWDEKTDVWRLEFSLHPDQKGIAVMEVTEDGELVCKAVHHFKNLDLLDNITDIYKHCFDTHFQFVHAEKTKKGNYRKQSRCEAVKLFDKMEIASCKIDLSVKKDSSRAVKIFAKKQMEFNQEMRGQDFELSIHGNEVFTKIILQHDLVGWAKKKLKGFDMSNLSPRIVKEYEALKNYDAGARDYITEKGRKEIAAVALRRKLEQQRKDAENFYLVPNCDSDGNYLGLIQAPF